MVIKLKHDLNSLINMVFNPLFYLTIGLLVGEASLSVIGLNIDLNSSVMYVMYIVALILMLGKRSIKGNKSGNVILLLYIYIFLRSVVALNEKIFSDYLLPNIVTCFIFSLLLCVFNRKRDIEGVITYMYIFLFVIMAIGTVTLLKSSEGRLAVFGGPNGLYKFALLFHCLSFMNYIEKKKLMYMAFSLVGLVIALATGSKGAMITMCIILIVEYICYLYMNNTSFYKIITSLFKVIIVTFTICIILFVIADKYPNFNRTFSRAISILDDNVSQSTSVEARNIVYDKSFDYFIDSPIFGKGPLYLYYDTIYTNNPQPYAHNIFLEILSEHGVIGLILLITVFIQFCTRIEIRYLKDTNYFGCILGIIIYFVGAQVSGNILDSKIIFFFMILAENYGNSIRRELNKNNEKY